MPGDPAGWSRPSWLSPLRVLFALAVLATGLFWFTDLDMAVAAHFYRPDDPRGPWPGETAPLWRFFYYGGPVFAVLLGAGALGALFWGLVRPSAARWRPGAALVLLTLVVGPGLLVNLVFKEHWGRPRPRQVEGLGGDRPYVPPLRPAPGDGKSFPAGHASVGFSLCALWLLWRRRHPAWAGAALAFSLLLGGLMGWGRMAAGAHFLSDVIWAGLITFSTALGLYYWVLRIPDRESGAGDEASGGPRPALLAGYGLLLLFLVFGAAMNYPVRRDLSLQETAPLPAEVEIRVDRGTVTLEWAKADGPPFSVRARIRGFGLPGFQIESYTRRPAGRLYYRLSEKGLFYELDARVRVRLRPEGVGRVRIRVDRGRVRLPTDLGRTRVEVLAPPRR